MLVSSLEAGVKSLENSISSQSAAAVDALAAQYVAAKLATPDEPPSPAAQVTTLSLFGFNTKHIIKEQRQVVEVEFTEH